MSALTITKKFTIVTATVFSALMLSGCFGNNDSVSEPSIADYVDAIDCYNTETGKGQAYDDVLTHRLEDGACGTSLEAAGEEAERQLALKEAEREHAIALASYEEAVATKVDGITDSSTILAEVVTYFCQTVDESDNTDALWEATEPLYDLHWRADGSELWPYRYADALDRFGCRVHYPAYSNYDDYYGPKPEEPLPPVEAPPGA